MVISGLLYFLLQKLFQFVLSNNASWNLGVIRRKNKVSDCAAGSFVEKPQIVVKIKEAESLVYIAEKRISLPNVKRLSFAVGF